MNSRTQDLQSEKWIEAISECDRAIAIDRDNALAWYEKALALMQLGQHSKALECFDTAIGLDPGLDFSFGERLSSLLKMCDLDGIAQSRPLLQRMILQGQRACMPFEVLVLFDDPSLQQHAARLWVQSIQPHTKSLPALAHSVAYDLLHEQTAPDTAGHPGKSHLANRKIRIAYFSADFRNHPVTTLLQGVIECHDRQKFEVIGICLHSTHDPMRQRIRSAFDEFHEFQDHSDKEIVECARRLRIDIAIDLGGFTHHNRFATFLSRLAPVQVSYLGYLGTSSSQAIDYLIADPVLIPAEQRQHYSESIVYLPWYQPNPAHREVACQNITRAQLDLPSSEFVFCCFNDSYKISPETFQSWMRILLRVPRSTLLLYVDNPSSANHLRQQARACGIEPRRLVFCGRVPVPTYMARFGVADLFLDTLPYNAGTTASDAVWTSTPVITLAGQSFAARMAASVLISIGMDELVTHSCQEYEDLAVSIATDPNRLQVLRKKLARCRSSGLFNPKAYTHHLESAYKQMFERASTGLPAQDLHLILSASDNRTFRLEHQPHNMHAKLQHKILDRVLVRPYEMPLVPCFNGGVVLEQASEGCLRHTRNHVPFDRITPLQPTERSALPVLPGCFIYGGPLYRHHFGHFMAECIHRILPSRNVFKENEWLFVVESGCAHHDDRLPGYIEQAFDLLGIDPERVTLIDQPTVVESLAICEQGSDLGGGPKEGYLQELHDYITPRLNALYGQKDRTSKVYVSRSNLLTGGTFLGERYLESLLQEEGFEIFRPEDHSLTWQMHVYRSAKALVFSEGSACHGVELLGAGSLGHCYLIARRQDIAQEFFTKILQPRAERFLVLNANKPLGTIIVDPAQKVPQPHREVCLYDVDALIRFFREESLASLRNFDKEKYYRAAAKDLWRYISHHFQHHRDWLDIKLVPRLLLNYLREGSS